MYIASTMMQQPAELGEVDALPGVTSELGEHVGELVVARRAQLRR